MHGEALEIILFFAGLIVACGFVALGISCWQPKLLTPILFAFGGICALAAVYRIEPLSFGFKSGGLQEQKEPRPDTLFGHADFILLAAAVVLTLVWWRFSYRGGKNNSVEFFEIVTALGTMIAIETLTVIAVLASFAPYLLSSFLRSNPLIIGVAAYFGIVSLVPNLSQMMLTRSNSEKG